MTLESELVAAHRELAETRGELAAARRELAASAIQNARLSDETKEAQERQKASADVLGAIGRSVSDAAPVFEEILNACERLFGSHEMGIYIVDADDMVRVAAWRGEARAEVRYDVTPLAESVTGRIIRERRTHHIPDLIANPNLTPMVRERAERLGNSSMLYAPMLREDRGLGSILVVRSPPKPFDEREIELLRTFADQAAIAVENVRLFDEVQARTRDLTESLQQQTATAEVLKVISRTAFDLDAVFTTLLTSAIHLSDADGGAICVREGEAYRYRSVEGTDAAPLFRQFLKDRPALAERASVAGRAILSGKVEQIYDVLADAEYQLPVTGIGNPSRAMIGVPMLREDRVEGVLVLIRAQPGYFTQRQIELVQTFADQAVIAIENVRLFDEVQARTRDLTEALQLQTAMADVLKVISRSAFDLETVLDTLISTAVRLCNASYGEIFRRHGEVYRYAASRMDVDPAYLRHEQNVEIGAGRGTLVGRVALENRAVSIVDAWSDPEYAEKDEARTGNVRAMLGVPLMRDGAPIGAFALGRSTPIPFSERQIELVQTFADQAVIAIENVRLFDEVQARTRDLSEALQQQTATSDVLKVISRSAFDLQAVFNTLVTSAVELGGALTGTICVRDGDVYRYRDTVGAEHTSALAQYLRQHPAFPGRSTIAGRVLLSGKVERIPDCLADPEYIVPMGALASNVRSLLGVPLLRKDGIEGAIILTRAEPGEFTARQIEIVQTFADQAVIALENVRLFDEVQARTRELSESLKQQTATAEVLKVISRSAFDLQVVLETLLRSAGELCEADTRVIWLRKGDLFYARATAGHDEEAARTLKANPRSLSDKSLVPRVARSGQVAHIADVLLDPDFDPPGGDLARLSVRTLLGVPLLHDGKVEGVFTLTRRRAMAFEPRQIEIVQTFADQAVIAIQNVRLFEQVQARTRELEQSLDDLRKTQDRLVASEKLASLGQLTAGIAHEIKNPLNFVTNFSGLSRDLLEELGELLAKAKLAEDERKEVDELMALLDSNLGKVVHHGKRADSIVKNMLLHSREGSGERTSAGVNAMVEEALNLAYHGARAEKPGFNVTIDKSLDAKAGVAELYPQEMTRVLLNLISNGFYATTKRQQSEANGAYEPTITASTRDLGDHVEICVRDNGTGIPDEVKAKMFNPFFTTKPAGEGTGLGLSLSHDIVVKQHGGTMDVATEPGAYTLFTIRLPRAGAGQ